MECAIRETLEETAIELDESMFDGSKMYDDPSIIISYPDGNIFRSITIAYWIKLTKEPKLICSAESKELKFFTKEELKSVKIVETHIPILHDYLQE